MTFLPLDIAVPQHLRMRASFPMRTFVVFLATIFISITPADASGPGKENDFAGRRVLLIGIDGCRADALRAAMGSGKAPTFRKLAAEGCANWSVFAGGEIGGATEQATKSGPGWSTVLTGVWRDRHGVSSNKFEQHRIAENPHFMRRIKDAKPSASCASLVTWIQIHDFIADPSRAAGAEFLDAKISLRPDPAKHAADWPEFDAMIRDRAVALLREKNPDAIFSTSARWMRPATRKWIARENSPPTTCLTSIRLAAWMRSRRTCSRRCVHVRISPRRTG